PDGRPPSHVLHAFSPFSPGGATDDSPGRKSWGNDQANYPAPEGRKNRPAACFLRPSGATHFLRPLFPRLAPRATFCRPSGAGDGNRGRTLPSPHRPVRVRRVG